MLERLFINRTDDMSQAIADDYEALMERTRIRQRDACEKLKREGKHCAYGYHPPKERILDTFLAERARARAATN